MKTGTIPAVALAAGFLIGGLGAATAGEVTGNGMPIEINGASNCAFSGIEDDEAVGGPGNVQTFGKRPQNGGGVSDDDENIPNDPGPAAPGTTGASTGCNPKNFVPPN